MLKGIHASGDNWKHLTEITLQEKIRGTCCYRRRGNIIDLDVAYLWSREKNPICGEGWFLHPTLEAG